jgi:hypothetical protein
MSLEKPSNVSSSAKAAASTWRRRPTFPSSLGLGLSASGRRVSVWMIGFLCSQ